MHVRISRSVASLHPMLVSLFTLTASTARSISRSEFQRFLSAYSEGWLCGKKLARKACCSSFDGASTSSADSKSIRLLRLALTLSNCFSHRYPIGLARAALSYARARSRPKGSLHSNWPLGLGTKNLKPLVRLGLYCTAWNSVALLLPKDSKVKVTTLLLPSVGKRFRLRSPAKRRFGFIQSSSNSIRSRACRNGAPLMLRSTCMAVQQITE